VFCNKLSINEGFSPAYSINGSTDPADWGVLPTNANATWNAVEIVADSDGYRLPTEAQWEYACRAGTTTAFNWGTDTINSSQANYDARTVDANNTVAGIYLARTTEVGSYAPNAWDLYDMHGNVYEWCWDWYGDYVAGTQTDPMGAVSGSTKVRRGGSFYFAAQNMRSASRSHVGLGYQGSSNGLRVVRP
jgi:formylglycine-generating enzyme required for sulfatase activity